MNKSQFEIIDKYHNNKLIQNKNIEESDKRVDISIIIPAYNEAKRCKMMIDTAINFMDRWAADNYKTYEFIFVDDGSQDNTINIA